MGPCGHTAGGRCAPVTGGDLAGVLGRLAMAVVEAGEDCDDRLGDGLAQLGLIEVVDSR